MSYLDNTFFETTKITPATFYQTLSNLTNATISRPGDAVTAYVADRLQTYLIQLTKKELTRGEFEAYIQDLKGLIRIVILKGQVTQVDLLQKTLVLLSDLLVENPRQLLAE